MADRKWRIVNVPSCGPISYSPYYFSEELAGTLAFEANQNDRSNFFFAEQEPEAAREAHNRTKEAS